MKKFLSCLLPAVTLLTLSACTTVVEKPVPSVHQTTTTTEQRSVSRPDVSATSETRTIRAY